MKQRLHLSNVYNTHPQAVWNLIFLNVILYVFGEWVRLLNVPDQKLGWVMAKSPGRSS